MGIFEFLNAVQIGFTVLNNFFSLFSQKDEDLESKVYGFSAMANDIKSMVKSGQIDEQKLYEIAKNLDDMADFMRKVYLMFK